MLYAMLMTIPANLILDTTIWRKEMKENDTVYYRAIIKIKSNYDDGEVNLREVASNYEDWLNDTLIDENVWGDGSVDVELVEWKKVKNAKNNKDK